MPGTFTPPLPRQTKWATHFPSALLRGRFARFDTSQNNTVKFDWEIASLEDPANPRMNDVTPQI